MGRGPRKEREITRHSLSADELEAYCRRAHAESIEAIPLAEFMGTRYESRVAEAAKRLLIDRAVAGEEVYAYHPTGSDRWNIWDPTTTPNCCGRISPLTWTEHYVHLLQARTVRPQEH